MYPVVMNIQHTNILFIRMRLPPLSSIIDKATRNRIFSQLQLDNDAAILSKSKTSSNSIDKYIFFIPDHHIQDQEQVNYGMLEMVLKSGFSVFCVILQATGAGCHSA